MSAKKADHDATMTVKASLIADRPQRVFAVVFETGDEVAGGLQAFARRSGVDAASFTAIGAMSDVVIGWFDLSARDYRRIPVREQVEVVSLIGDVTRADDESDSRDPARTVHGHIVVARADGTTLGGHLLEGHVRPTLEVIVTESPAHLRRRHDPDTGLALVDLGRNGDRTHALVIGLSDTPDRD